jgi:hypothetical protein
MTNECIGCARQSGDTAMLYRTAVDFCVLNVSTCCPPRIQPPQLSCRLAGVTGTPPRNTHTQSVSHREVCQSPSTPTLCELRAAAGGPVAPVALCQPASQPPHRTAPHRTAQHDGWSQECRELVASSAPCKEKTCVCMRLSTAANTTSAPCVLQYCVQQYCEVGM